MPKEPDAFAQSTEPFHLPSLIAGHSYEKEAILEWLAKNETSPITRNKLRRKHLVPNRALKEAINFEGDFDLFRTDFRDEIYFRAWSTFIFLFNHCHATLLSYFLMMHMCSRQQRKTISFRLIIIAEARGRARSPPPLSPLRPR